MPSLGSGLSLGTLNKISGVDYDVSAYFQTAGITNATARSQINTFALGLKSLGLWDTSICWMLKSSLNAGTGSVVYSFGGLGSYNGSLVNSPTWGSTGISFTNTNQQINLPDDANLYNLRTGFVVFSSGSEASNQRLIEFQDNATLQGWYCLFRYGGGTGESGIKYDATRNSTANGNNPSGQLALLNSFQTGAFSANNTSDNLFRDGSLISGSARTGLPSLNPTGGRALRQLFANSSSMVGTFGFMSTATLTNAQISSLHSLYVSTFASNRDLDADAYIVRAGVTDPTAQTQINDFVIGAKSLGVWDNMVCWPLRSSQNAGTGTTAYSLGGLGTYNGTMTAGISWQSDGLLANTASQRVSFSNPLDLATINTASLFSVLNVQSFSGSGWFSNLFSIRTDGFSPNNKGLRFLIFCDANSNNIEAGGTAIFTDGSTELKRQYNRGSGAYVGTGFHSLGASIQANPNAVEFSYDGSLQGSLVDSTTSTAFINAGSSNYFLGTSDFSGNVLTLTGSFYSVFNTYLSNSVRTSLSTLYKNTLGTGLGLP